MDCSVLFHGPRPLQFSWVLPSAPPHVLKRRYCAPSATPHPRHPHVCWWHRLTTLPPNDPWDSSARCSGPVSPDPILPPVQRSSVVETQTPRQVIKSCARCLSLSYLHTRACVYVCKYKCIALRIQLEYNVLFSMLFSMLLGVTVLMIKKRN